MIIIHLSLLHSFFVPVQSPVRLTSGLFVTELIILSSRAVKSPLLFHGDNLEGELCMLIPLPVSY